MQLKDRVAFEDQISFHESDRCHFRLELDCSNRDTFASHTSTQYDRDTLFSQHPVVTVLFIAQDNCRNILIFLGHCVQYFVQISFQTGLTEISWGVNCPKRERHLVFRRFCGKACLTRNCHDLSHQNLENITFLWNLVQDRDRKIKTVVFTIVFSWNWRICCEPGLKIIV